MKLISRFKNLWELGRYKSTKDDSGVHLEEEIYNKPKGMATIVEDEPEDQFPTEDPNL